MRERERERGRHSERVVWESLGGISVGKEMEADRVFEGDKTGGL